MREAKYDIPDNIPETAADLIRQLLHPDPLQRMSLEVAIEHHFLRAVTPTSSVFSLSGFHSSNDSQQIQPFSTVHIPTISHQTRTTRISVQQDGWVVLYVSSGSEPREMHISPDGTHVQAIYGKSSQRYEYLALEQLPRGLKRRYRYVASFIDMVRARTVVVTYLRFGITATLMLNGDMRVKFSDEISTTYNSIGQVQVNGQCLDDEDLFVRATRKLYLRCQHVLQRAQKLPVIVQCKAPLNVSDSLSFDSFSLSLNKMKTIKC